MIAEYEQLPLPDALKIPRPYALGLMHKHLPEMRVHTGLKEAPIFSPLVANFYKGLAVTVPLPLRQLPVVCGRAVHPRAAFRRRKRARYRFFRCPGLQRH
jgi:N-acetyl-gamma-glutamylphosphate reductase